MSKLDELYRLHRLIDGRRTGLPRAALITEHGFSRSTLSRLIADLRDKLGAPLIHDKDRNGYRYDTADALAVRYQLVDDLIVSLRVEIERPEASSGLGFGSSLSG